MPAPEKQELLGTDWKETMFKLQVTDSEVIFSLKKWKEKEENWS